MTIHALKKHLRRELTVMLIPHGAIRPLQLSTSLAFLLAACVLWSGLTLWAGYIVSRHVDYWRTKANDQILRAKVWYLARQIEKSEEYIDRLHEVEIGLEGLLNLKTRKAMVESDRALGGPTGLDQKQLSQLLTGRMDNVTLNDMRGEFDTVQRAGDGVVSDFQQISRYIQDQHDLFLSTPRAWPAEGRLTSGFGVRVSRLDDLGGKEFHRGIDIANHLGTPVRATADGLVRLASWEGGYGRLVVLEHRHGFRTYYAHNAQLLVSAGDYVKRGKVIAYMGTSGRSTGYHLHYEVWRNGQAIDPIAFVKVER